MSGTGSTSPSARWRAAGAEPSGSFSRRIASTGGSWITTVLKTLVLGVLDGVVVAVVVLLTTLVALLGT
jgi:hypothetical protein